MEMAFIFITKLSTWSQLFAGFQFYTNK